MGEGVKLQISISFGQIDMKYTNAGIHKYL